MAPGEDRGPDHEKEIHAKRPISAVLLRDDTGNIRPLSNNNHQVADRLVVWTPAGDGDVAPVETVGDTMLITKALSGGRYQVDTTAPAVERFSTARYQPIEWERFNYQTLNKSRDTQRDVLLREADARSCIKTAASRSDTDQRSSSRLLSARAHEVHSAQSELARAAWLCREEEELLETQRQRLRAAISALTRPRAIATECLARRHDRLEQDLVQDPPENEFHREVALLEDVRGSLESALDSSVQQLRSSRAARDRLERDWGGKTEARRLEAACLDVNTARSKTSMLHPACTRLPHGQSMPLHWESYTNENLAAASQERESSRRMREDIEQLLTTAARALRTQADVVESALEVRIAETDENLQSIEEQLKQILIRTSETEKLRGELRVAIANHGIPLRVAHTRLETRLIRPGVESCRDAPQSGLLNEVRRVEDTLSSLRARLADAENSLAELVRVRSHLEHDIRIRRQSLTVDRTRCRELRQAFPSTVHLTGY